MLLKLSNLVREAQEHALNCAACVARASTAEAKQEWRQIETGWMHLAETYLLVENLQHYLLSMDVGGEEKIEPPQHPRTERDRADESDAPGNESRYRLLADACRRKADAEPSAQGKIRWLELAEDWARLSEADRSSKK
jgi:hypothetical protein